MEPHATVAAWDADGALTLYETTQHIFGTKELVSIVLGMPLEKINVVSHFLGGGFGGKAYVWPHTLLAAIAAKVLNRPVRIQLTRAQMYSMVGHQPATIQTIALGADRRRQAHRHSPRKHLADTRFRQLHRIRGNGVSTFVGGRRRESRRTTRSCM